MTTPQSRRAPAHCTLDQVVAHWAQRQPDAVALRWHDDADTPALSWREFQNCIAHTADALRSTVASGDAVAVVCASNAAFHVLVNALWRLGAGVVLIDRNWGPALVTDLIALVGCRAIFADAHQSVLDTAGVERRAIPELTRAADRAAAESPVAADLDRVAIYATTSGTTDNPKCVAITHRQIRSAYDACLTVHDFSAVAACACLFEVNSLGVLGVCFLLQREIGAGTTVFPSFSLSNIAATWRAVVLDRSIGFVYLVPPLVRLLNTLPVLQPHDREMLAFCSAAPVAEAELRRLESRFALRVFNSYGLTELTFAVFFGCRDADDGASESIGVPVGISARLVDDAGAIVEGAGSGELHIAGPMLTAGYLHNPSATGASWDACWLRTGDIAERDGLGRYYIRGRKKDVVLRGGYTYYLHELEHYLRRAPQVVDACAFKGRDLSSGDELCVVVQTSEPLAPETLLAWVREQLGATKLPNALYVWSRALPRNSNGKIQRKVLSALHAQGRMHAEEPV